MIILNFSPAPPIIERQRDQILASILNRMDSRFVVKPLAMRVIDVPQRRTVQETLDARQKEETMENRQWSMAALEEATDAVAGTAASCSRSEHKRYQTGGNELDVLLSIQSLIDIPKTSEEAHKLAEVLGADIDLLEYRTSRLKRQYQLAKGVLDSSIAEKKETLAAIKRYIKDVFNA